MAQTFEEFINQIELIKSSEARLYQFLEQMPIGVFIIDKEYNIIFSNQRSNEILGWTFVKNRDFTQIKNYLELFKANQANSEYGLHELPLIQSLKTGEKVAIDDMIIINQQQEKLRLKVYTTPIYIHNQIEYALAVYDVIPLTSDYVLTELLNFDCSTHSYTQFNEFVTTLLCKYLNVTRVGIWLNEPSYIECLDLYDSEKNEHQKGIQIFKRDFPVYFRYILKGHILSAEDALIHEKTREFKSIYFEPLQIQSTLDCPIFVNHQLHSIICCEMLYRKRKWKATEIEFMKSFTKLLSWLIEKYYFML
ncbi:MAG: hypothetical protein KatS3mg035_0535 [Bacteroidia bacterium]|nr:MAG: hypothetical protein KatS3mg035_0535 [Bacteroidia bacterium]